MRIHVYGCRIQRQSKCHSNLFSNSTKNKTIWIDRMYARLAHLWMRMYVLYVVCPCGFLFLFLHISKYLLIWAISHWKCLIGRFFGWIKVNEKKKKDRRAAERTCELVTCRLMASGISKGAVHGLPFVVSATLAVTDSWLAFWIHLPRRDTGSASASVTQ